MPNLLCEFFPGSISHNLILPDYYHTVFSCYEFANDGCTICIHMYTKWTHFSVFVHSYLNTSIRTGLAKAAIACRFVQLLRVVFDRTWIIITADNRDKKKYG